MAKYILQEGVTEVDFWDKNGKITVNQNATQEQLAYLYSLNYDGVVKIDTPEVQPNKASSKPK